MSVVIGEFQIDAQGEEAETPPGSRAPGRPVASPTASAAPPAPVRVQMQSMLRHYRERLARVRS